MPAPEPVLTGDALLVAVTDAMVALHERYHQRAPVTAKTQLLGGDLLACVLGGVYTRGVRPAQSCSGRRMAALAPARRRAGCTRGSAGVGTSAASAGSATNARREETPSLR